jgi:hypothetical protein
LAGLPLGLLFDPSPITPAGAPRSIIAYTKSKSLTHDPHITIGTGIYSSFTKKNNYNERLIQSITPKSARWIYIHQAGRKSNILMQKTSWMQIISSTIEVSIFNHWHHITMHWQAWSTL